MTGWVRSAPSGRKRGRPPKALEDLAESSRRARDRAADKEEVNSQIAPVSGLAAKLKHDRLHAQHLRTIAQRSGTSFGGVAVQFAPDSPQHVGLVDPMQSRPKLRPVRRSTAADRAATVGIGSEVKVYWPPAIGSNRGRFWPGVVTALIPSSEVVVEQVVQYADGGRYRHDFAACKTSGAGTTKFKVTQLVAPSADSSCQQGSIHCTCSANPQQPHCHDWYAGNSTARAACTCYFCGTGTVVDAGTPALDYQDTSSTSSGDVERDDSEGDDSEGLDSDDTVIETQPVESARPQRPQRPAARASRARTAQMLRDTGELQRPMFDAPHASLFVGLCQQHLHARMK